MKKTHFQLVFTGLLVAFAVAGTNKFKTNNLAVDVNNELAHTISPRLDDRELGIGDYGERGHSDAPRLDDKELGIGEFSEQA